MCVHHLCTPPVCNKNMTILCTWDHLLFVRPPMWAGPDPGVYQEMPSELKCCSDCAARFRLEEMLACVCTTFVHHLSANKHDHSLYMGPPIICPSAHVGWTGPDQTVCACVAICVVYSCSHCVQVWRVRLPIWAGPDSGGSNVRR